jgi:hypothetical protein
MQRLKEIFSGLKRRRPLNSEALKQPKALNQSQRDA